MNVIRHRYKAIELYPVEVEAASDHRAYNLDRLRIGP
jgi:hypothetical protein